MYFYLKLSNKSDDSKLKGITLFKNCKIPLILGEGKSEYYLDNRSENYWTDSEYTDEIVDCIKLIAKILPDARICYQSVEDEGSGESDVYCKLENDSIIYTCSTLWFEGTHYRIGEDGWCKQVVRQAIEWAEDEESPLMDIYDREVEIENGIIIKHSEEELEEKKNSKVIDEQDFSVQEVTENKVVSSAKITIVNIEEPVDISKESKKSLDNYKTVNKTSDASQKDWFVSPMPTTPVKQIRVKLNNGKSYEYASRYAVSEGSIAVIGYSLPVDFCCEISKSNNTGAMGYVEKISPNLTIKRRYAVEADYIFNTNPAKTDLTRCVKYLKLGPEAYEKTLQFDKAVHPIRPIIYFARRILTATSILAHPNFVTEDDLKCAKNVILSRNHIDSKMIARSPGVALLESNVSEKEAQNTFNKIAIELGNHEDWDKDSGTLQSWSDVLNKFVSLSSVNEFVDKYSHVVAVSIMIRGGFLNLLKAYMSVTSLNEYRDEICAALQGIDQTETFDFFKTAPKFVGDLSSAESGSQTIENNQQNRTTTSLLNMDKDVQEHNDQDTIFKAKEVVQENILDEAYRKAQEEVDEDAEHLYREAEERRIREEAERERKLREEARKSREEAESKALEDAYRKAQEDAARRATLVAESQAREEERKAREDAERLYREAEERRIREEAERERKLREEARKAREEAESKALEDAYRKAQEDAVRRAALVAERQAREEAERQAREEEERQVRQEEERIKREEAERKTREEEERKAREDVERKVREEDDRQVREAKEKIHITETAILNLEAQIAAEVKKAKEAKIAEERRLEEKTKESEIVIAAEEAQRSEERRLRRKKRAKKALIVLGIFLVLIVALVIVFAKVIFPKIAYKNAEELFAEGKYEQAESWYNALGDHEDGEIKLTVIRAYSQIEDGNYNEAIESLLEKGICVTISYDIENDATLMASEVMLLSASNNNGNTFTYTNKSAFDGMKSPSRTGYQFDKWRLVSYQYNEDNTFALSLSSEWTVECYEINIELDGGTASNRDSYTIEDATFSLVNPTKIGYTFIGWSCNNSEVLTMTATIDHGSHGNISYVAKWTANDFTINLDAAGGSVESNSISVKYDATYTLPAPTLKGHTFQGWYNGNTKVEDGTYILTQDLNLVAKWTANQYKVTYDDVAWQKIQIKVTLDYNGADKENSEIVLHAGDKLTYDLVGSPYRSNYIFRGWFLDVACTQFYKFNTSVTDDITLYAGWQEDANHYDMGFTLPKHNGYNRFDVSSFDSSSESWDVSVSGYSAYADYIYISVNESGTHRIYYYCSRSYIKMVFRVYNLTKKTLIDGDSWKENYYSKYQYFEFYCDEGDMLAITIEQDSLVKDIEASLYFEGFTSYATNVANVDIPSGEELAYNKSQSYEETVIFGNAINMPVPVRKGYTFDGWYYNGKKVEDGEWNLDEDVTLEAHWKSN